MNDSGGPRSPRSSRAWTPPGGRPRRPARRTAGARRQPPWIPPWRKGLPPRPQEDPAAEGAGAPQALGGVLEDLLASSGRLQSGLAVGDLSRRWEEVVGRPLADETSPGGLDDAGVLTVRTSSAAWAAQIRFLAGTLAGNANEVLGRALVTGVRVVVEPAERRPDPGSGA